MGTKHPLITTSPQLVPLVRCALVTQHPLALSLLLSSAIIRLVQLSPPSGCGLSSDMAFLRVRRRPVRDLIGRRLRRGSLNGEHTNYAVPVVPRVEAAILGWGHISAVGWEARRRGGLDRGEGGEMETHLSQHGHHQLLL